MGAFFYSLVVRARLLLYRTKILPTHLSPFPVISVGNLTVGGSGKTPFVELLAKMALSHHQKPVLLSRGYHPLPGQDFNDEALLLKENLPEVPQLLGGDRVALTKRAWEDHHPDCALLDDGFQHIRLHRDLNILLVDALCPFGYGKLLPAGLLREPLSQIKRAHLIGLTRSDQQSEEDLIKIEETLQKYTAVPIFRVGLKMKALVEKATGEVWTLEETRQKKGYGFCGVGSPLSFQKTLEGLEMPLVGFEAFPDHHHYSSQEMEDLCQKAQKEGAQYLITTQKDGVKVASLPDGFPLVVLKVECSLIRGAEVLEKALLKACQKEK